jgi:thiamine pyrophosphate-dependent acetolactate synthase large subunit-like protein
MRSTAVKDQDAAPAAAVTARPGRYAMLEQLRADGVRFMFGNPGTVEQGFLDSIAEFPDIQYVLTLQETIAVGVGDGYARAARKPAVVQLHSGVGLGNGVGMLYQAKRGHAPLVVFAGESGVAYDAMDAQMASDLVAIARPVTKWSTRVLHPSSLLRVIRRAIKIASTPPMGPVFVALPMDVLDAPNTEVAVPTSIPVTRVTPSDEDVAAAARLLGQAERPLVIFGDGVAFSGGQRALVEVAEALGADVWGADSSEVSIPASHPQYRGQLGHMFGSHSTPIVQAADAVLVAGTYLLPEVFPNLEGIFAPGAAVIHVDLDAYEIAKNFPVTLGLVADPALTLGAIATALQKVMKPEQVKAAAARRGAARTRRDEEDEQARAADRKAWDQRPMRPARFMSELASRLGGKALIFDEALTSSPDLTRYIPPDEPGSYFQTRGGSLGVGIPGALGAKLAHPEKTVIGFTGDGGSMYTIQALWTAAHHGIGAKFVICNNGSYKLLKLNIQQYWRERGLAEHDFPASFDLMRPDIRFDQLAKAMGVGAVRVERPEEIGPALDAALADDSPFLIDLVLTDEVAGHGHVRCGQ